MNFNRRSILAAAPAAAAASAFSGSAFAQAQTAPATQAPPAQMTPQPSAAGTGQAPGFYRYKIGDIEVTAVNDGVWSRPLDAGFVKNAPLEEVKKAQEQAFLPADVTPVPFTTTVLKTGGKVILIDTGNGNSGAPGTGSWMANFKAAGFEPGPGRHGDPQPLPRRSYQRPSPEGRHRRVP